MAQLLVALGLLLTSALALAQGVQQQILQVDLRHEAPNVAIAARVVVRVVWSGRPEGRPLALLLHGRPEDPAQFASMNVWDYPLNARYFAELGYLVLIPTRIGYGATGGPDIEYTGPCDRKQYLEAVSAASGWLTDLIAHFSAGTRWRAQPGVVIGESYGGLLALALAGRPGLPGIVAAVNMAGGDGGSLAHLDTPCSPLRMAGAMAQWGERNLKPTLWVYSQNDRLWGSLWPRLWFGAFRLKGGDGTFAMLGPDKNNGHYIFTRNQPAWADSVAQFLAAQPGLTTRRLAGAP